jgi:hypothetical protein
MRNFIITLLFLVPFLSFGQTKVDTTIIYIPYSVAKQIALDLNKLDSITAISKLTDKELKETQKKVVVQDSIINTMELKEDNYLLQIKKEGEKYTIVDDQNKDLRTDIKKLKTKNTIIEIVGGAIIGALTYITLFK